MAQYTTPPLRIALSEELMGLLRSLVPAASASSVSHKLESIMQNLADIQALLADLSTKEDAVLALVQTEASQLTALQAQVADLQAQVAAGQPVDLQPLADSITAMSAKAQAVLDAHAPPAPPAQEPAPPAEPTAAS